MRQINIRGWYIKEKRWANEEELRDFTSLVIEPNGKVYLSIDGGDEENNGEPYFNVEQDTNGKDKFGAAIYEGDIVEDSQGRHAAVTLDGMEFVAYWESTEEERVILNLLSVPESVVVVGNIHENPELLEQE